MPTNIILQSRLSDVEKLHKLTNGSAKSVRVDSEVLQRLLIDHSVMYRAIIDNKAVIQIKEPRNREKM